MASWAHRPMRTWVFASFRASFNVTTTAIRTCPVNYAMRGLTGAISFGGQLLAGHANRSLSVRTSSFIFHHFNFVIMQIGAASERGTSTDSDGRGHDGARGGGRPIDREKRANRDDAGSFITRSIIKLRGHEAANFRSDH